MCMTLIAGKGISTTGKVIVAHNEDDAKLCKVFKGFVPSKLWEERVIPAEKGRALIPQVSHTKGYLWTEVKMAKTGLSSADGYFNDAGVLVVSNASPVSSEDLENESRLSEGGIEGNLRRVVAERASSAKEALNIAIEMVEKYGYAPRGRNYTFADKDEAYMMQIVSGKNYMAVRIPDDFVAVMPNHYTLHSLKEFPVCFYSKTLISHAIEKGWYKPQNPDNFDDFDFAKAYTCDEENMHPANVFRGKNAFSLLLNKKWDKENMPFGCYPDHKVSARELADILSSHYEGTEDDSERFGPGNSPHNTNVRRICTGTTLDSVVCEFSENPLFTRLWSCLGRPCQLPYLPVHPLAGLPKILSNMKDPEESAKTHYLYEPEKMLLENTLFDEFRKIQDLLEMNYEDSQKLIRPLLRKLWDEDVQLCEKAENVSTWLTEDVKKSLIMDCDNKAIKKDCEAILALKNQLSVVNAKAEKLSLEAIPEKIKVYFDCDEMPKEESLVFGLFSLNVRTEFANCIEKSLKKEAEGFSAEFFTERFKEDLLCKGSYLFALGGKTEKSFGANVIVEVI